jgi:heme exporter protein A
MADNIWSDVMSQLLRLMAENLVCERAGRVIFSNLNFTINAGEFVELRGQNGVGKSSLLRLIAGLNEPASGTLILDNADQDKTIAEQSHYIGHAEANKPALTVAQNVTFWARFLSGDANPSCLAHFKLEALAQDQALLLSAGQKRRLALTRLVAIKRRVWLLDEPSVGLDAASLSSLQKLIATHLQEGGIVLAATHQDLGIASARQLQLGGSE